MHSIIIHSLTRYTLTLSLWCNSSSAQKHRLCAQFQGPCAVYKVRAPVSCLLHHHGCFRSVSPRTAQLVGRPSTARHCSLLPSSSKGIKGGVWAATPPLDLDCHPRSLIEVSSRPHPV